MTFAIGITAILVSIIAYGIGKLSVYVQQDNERDPMLPDDPVQAWEPRQVELWSKAQENKVIAERELAKLVSTLSLAGIAGVVALGQLKIINTVGMTVLIAGFLLSVCCCIANLERRQSLLDRRVRQLQEAFDQGQPVRRLPHDTLSQHLVSALPKAAAVLFCIALLLILLTLAASRTDCNSVQSQYGYAQLYCSDFIQELVRKD